MIVFVGRVWKSNPYILWGGFGNQPPTIDFSRKGSETLINWDCTPSFWRCLMYGKGLETNPLQCVFSLTGWINPDLLTLTKLNIRLFVTVLV
jgi:hypothetical protein